MLQITMSRGGDDEKDRILARMILNEKTRIV